MLKVKLAAAAAAGGVIGIAGHSAAAPSSVGTGIQAAPVLLARTAQPGRSYSLPRLLVTNTGSGPELISVRVWREQGSRGLRVPSSWINAGTVTVGAGRGAWVPVVLSVPGNAVPGRYASDLLASGSPVSSVPPGVGGMVAFGAAAATGLEFTVGPGRTGPGS